MYSGPAEQTCRFCGEVWSVLVGEFGHLHEDDCELRYMRERVVTLESKLEASEKKRDGVIMEWRAAMDEIERLQPRLDALNKELTETENLMQQEIATSHKWAAKANAAESRLGTAVELFDRIYKQFMEGADGYQRLVTCSDIERWKEGKPLSAADVERGETK